MKFRYWIKFFAAFWKRFKSLLFLGTVLGIVSFFIIPRFTPLLVNFVEGERVGIIGRYGIDDLPLDLQSEISIGLTKLNETGNAIPGLAVSWEAQEDGKVWVFKLGNYKWQDGTKVKSSDINYNFTDVLSETLDDRTIKFILKDPFSPFPSIVSRPIFKRGLLGTGEWKVSKFSLVNSGEYLEYIKLIKDNQIKTIKFFDAEETARTALKLGKIDQIQEIIDLKDLANWKNLSVSKQIRRDRYVGIFINNEDPILSDKSLRQALTYAIDKSVFDGERAISPISLNSWAYNPQVKQYAYNPDRARELLKSLPKDQLKNLSIKLATTPSLLLIADKIKTNWEAIGVKTHVQVSNVPFENFQTLLAIQSVPADPDQYSFWHSTQISTNVTKYHTSKESQRIDKLLEDGRRTLDQEERKKIYQDFQRFLVEDSPVIFLYHPVTYTISRK